MPSFEHVRSAHHVFDQYTSLLRNAYREHPCPYLFNHASQPTSDTWHDISACITRMLVTQPIARVVLLQLMLKGVDMHLSDVVKNVVGLAWQPK